MQNESNNSTVINELEGPLREAVERICSGDIPQDRLNKCLNRLLDLSSNDVQNNNVQVKTSEPSSLVSRPSRRYRWIAAAGTATVLTAMVLIHLSSMSVSLADVAQAVSRKKWIQLTVRATAGEKELGEKEEWYSPNREVTAMRENERIVYHDHKLKVYNTYDVAERILYRVPAVGKRPQNPWSEITETLPRLLAGGDTAKLLSEMKFAGSQGDELHIAEQKMKKVTEGGREWLDYTLTVKARDVDQPVTILFRVDPGSNLPHLSRVTGQHDGQAFRYDITIAYPETGPEDIYAIGVPRDAKLVDRIPKDDLARLIAGVAAGRVRFDDFRAFVVPSHGEGGHWLDSAVEMIHRKGNRIRRDMGSVGSDPVRPAHDVDASAWWSQHAKEFSYTLASIGIAGVEQMFRQRTITEPNGSERYEIVPGRPFGSALNAEQWIPSFYTLTPDYAGRPPLGIPSERMEAIIETDPGDGPEGTVLLRVVPSGRRDSSTDPDTNKQTAMPGGSKFWIDPAREYLVMRWDMQNGSHIVETVAQSPKGHWYPTRVRRKSSDPAIKDTFLDFYVEFDVEIPDALFDVKNPLPVEELLRKSP